MNSQPGWFKYRYAAAGEVWRVAATLAASMPVAEMMREDGPHKIRPDVIAKLACDIAAAVANELLEREWIELCETPKGADGS